MGTTYAGQKEKSQRELGNWRIRIKFRIGAGSLKLNDVSAARRRTVKLVQRTDIGCEDKGDFGFLYYNPIGCMQFTSGSGKRFEIIFKPA